MGAVLLAGFLFPVRFTKEREFWEYAMDFAHVPIFVLITVYLQGWTPRSWLPEKRAIAALAASLAIAAVVELLQLSTGRQASFGDWLYGACGAYLVFLFSLAWHKGLATRFTLVLYAALLTAATLLPAWRKWSWICWRSEHFPLIANFEEPAEFRNWRGKIEHDLMMGGSLRPSSIGVAKGSQSAEVRIHPLPFEPAYPGIRLYLADQDWRPYQKFALEIFNPGTAFELSIRIDDDREIRKVTDRYNGAVPIHPGWNHVEIPLFDIAGGVAGPPLRLSSIRRLTLFLDNPKSPRTFHLDWIRLE